MEDKVFFLRKKAAGRGTLFELQVFCVQQEMPGLEESSM